MPKYDYYHLPSDLDELLSVADSISTEDIIMGRVNPCSLCRRLATEIRILRRRSKGEDEIAILEDAINGRL